MEELEEHSDRLEEIADLLGRINSKLDHLKPSLLWSVAALLELYK